MQFILVGLLTSRRRRAMSATLDGSAAIGQRASGPSPSPPVGRGVALARSVARAARMGTQAAHAHLHEIECVERLGLNSLMRALLS